MIRRVQLVAAQVCLPFLLSTVVAHAQTESTAGDSTDLNALMDSIAASSTASQAAPDQAPGQTDDQQAAPAAIIDSASPIDASAEKKSEPEILDTIPVTQKKESKEEAPEPKHPNAPQIDEIVVTANKRNESSRTIAGAVTAIDKSRLQETGASNLGDYLALAPGVNFNSGTPGYSVISIRGVSTDTIPGASQTAVGTYYDDIPLTDPAAPIVVPDIDAFDAQRVEVLRGPQGALYGSASMGGAVNYVPSAPNFTASEFSMQANGSLTRNSSLAGGGKLMFNSPLFNNTALSKYGFAVRGLGYYSVTPGYIDNIGMKKDQSNEAKVGGGRVILGWAPTDNSVIRATALYQKTTIADAGYVDPSLGDLKKSTLTFEPSNNEFRLASLRYELEEDYGSWAFVGGYQQKKMLLALDGSTALGLSATGLKVPLAQFGDVKGYSGELRFVSSPSEKFNWLAGLSYADRKENLTVTLNLGALQDAADLLSQLGQALNLGVLSSVGNSATLDNIHGIIKAPEAAAFIDGTYYFTPDLKLSAGGRLYHNKIDSEVIATGVLTLPAGSLKTDNFNKTKATGFNPKVSLSWQADERALLYGLYSRGYRLGGINLVPTSPLSNIKPTYNPDTVDNFEVGAKTNWLDGMLTADVSGFWINWKAIPLQIQDSTGIFKYLDNAGNARSRGLELSLALRPVEILTLRSSLTYMRAQLLNDYDPKNNRPPAKAGDQLPGAPTFAASNSATAVWAWGEWSPSLTLIHRYEGKSATNLSFQDIKKGGYNLIDLRAGIRRGHFALTAYGKNLTDAHAVTAANDYAKTSGGVLELQYINPPRTVGVELSYSFNSEE